MNCCDDSETGNYSCFACRALVRLMSAGISLPLSFESLLSFLGFIFSMMTLRTTFYCFTANVFAGFGLLSHEQVLLVSLDAASKVSELAIGFVRFCSFPVHSIHSDTFCSQNCKSKRKCTRENCLVLSSATLFFNRSCDWFSRVTHHNLIIM